MRTAKWVLVSLITVVLIAWATTSHAQGDALSVTNVQVQQRPFTELVDVTYDLETVGGLAVTVRLYLSTDSGSTYPFLCRAVTGDVGEGVLPGASRAIVWDAGVDVPELSSSECRLRITADDGVDPAPFVRVEPGTFGMGSPADEPGRYPYETLHQVTLTRGVWVQTTEVTNQQYTDLAQWAFDQGLVFATGAYLRDNLDGSTEDLKALGGGAFEISFSLITRTFTCVNPDHPVKYVTWYGAAAYCDWLSLQQGLPRAYDHRTWQCNGGDPYAAVGYRLPTEAEWEYACRAGATTAFANGPITQLYCAPLDPNLDQMGWYCGQARDWTSAVGQKQPNAWGLYDMHGNVHEWCNDRWGWFGGAVTDPVGPATGSGRVLRGGGWDDRSPLCRSAYRYTHNPTVDYDYLGFRVARTAAEPAP